jgi:hypothetical protein
MDRRSRTPRGGNPPRPGYWSGMTTTPEEPAPEPEVVPSGDPAPIETDDPEPQTDPLP